MATEQNPNLDDLVRNMREIFTPTMIGKINQFEDGSIKWAHYTDASTAMKILKNEEFWFRNVRCMNDYSEILHGLNYLTRSWESDSISGKLKQTLEDRYPGILQNIGIRFSNHIENLINDTFISCFAEHDPIKDANGLLSMWRAYGRKQPVALIIDPSQIFQQSTTIPTSPVNYEKEDVFRRSFNSMGDRFIERKDAFAELPLESLAFIFSMALSIYCISQKHYGFEEEKEWRMVHIPVQEMKDQCQKSFTETIEDISGTPQLVQKLNFNHLSFTNFVEKIIIGPTPNPDVQRDAFVSILRNKGYSTPEDRVSISEIPFRQQ